MTSRRTSGPGHDATQALAVTTPVASVGTTARTPVPGLAPGTVLANRYVVVRFVAAGGMGEVYEVEDRELGERVALKTIRAEVAAEPQVVERFKREIQLARKVTHPNVCRAYDVGVHQDGDAAPFSFLTMELLDGEPLSALIARKGRLEIDEARRLLVQMAAGLDAAHAAGIIHRDFKSQNVVLVPGERGPRVVITDFGLARASDPRSSDAAGLTGQVVLGSPAYMAPEQVTGAKVSPATDVYSMSVVAFEMVTGTLPFIGETLLATAAQRLERDPPDPRTRVADLPGPWSRTILRAMSRDPDRRFASAGAMIDALSSSSPRRRSPFVVAGVVALGLGVAVVAWTVSRSERSPASAPGVDAGARVSLEPTGSVEERAVAYLEREETAAARALLEQGLAANPRDTHLRVLLVHVLLAQDATGRAGTEIDRAMADATAITERDRFLLMAARAERDGGLAAAADALRMAYTEDPGVFVGTLLVRTLADDERYADAEAALAALRQLPDLEPDRPVLSLLAGEIADLQSRYAQARDQYDAAIAAAERRGWSMVVARALRARGWNNAFLGDLSAAAGDGEASLAAYDAGGEHLRTGPVLNLLAIVYYYRGEYARCLDTLDRGLEVARQIDDRSDREFFTINRALIQAHIGKLGEASKTLDELAATPGARMRDVAVLFAGLVALRQGDVAKAKPLLEETSGTAHDKLLATWALRGLAEAALLTGDVPEARRQVEACIDRGGEIGFAPGLWPCRALLAEVLFAEGRHDLAAAQARQAANELTRIGALDEAAWAQLILVRVLRAARDPSVADALGVAEARATTTEDPGLRIAIQIEVASARGDMAGLELLAAEASELGFGALAEHAREKQ